MTGKRERKRRLAVVHTLLPLFNDRLRMEMRCGRLWLVCEWHRPGREPYHAEAAATLNGSGCSLGCRYGKLGMGGTNAQAVAMLVRWVRGLSRLPRATWAYWCSPSVQLAGGAGGGDALLAALDASGYFDPPAETGCVFCGSQRIVDWWSCDGDPTGPCCSHTGCNTNPPAAARATR